MKFVQTPIQYRLGKILLLLEIVCHARSAQTNPVSDIRKRHSPDSNLIHDLGRDTNDCVPLSLEASCAG